MASVHAHMCTYMDICVCFRICMFICASACACVCLRRYIHVGERVIRQSLADCFQTLKRLARKPLGSPLVPFWPCTAHLPFDLCRPVLWNVCLVCCLPFTGLRQVATSDLAFCHLTLWQHVHIGWTAAKLFGSLWLGSRGAQALVLKQPLGFKVMFRCRFQSVRCRLQAGKVRFVVQFRISSWFAMRTWTCLEDADT